MKSNKTDGVILGGLLAWLLYEGYTLVNGEKQDTISERVWRVSKRPMVPFLAGALMAHFFWQSQEVYEEANVL